MLSSLLLSALLVINELMASNAGQVISPAVNYDSWIELYNPGTTAVDLGGMTLRDHAGNSWQMPSDMGTVPAGGFKVVWLGSNDIKENQATFKLDCDGGTIYLDDAAGDPVTSLDYPEALSRTSWACKTDGGTEFGWTDDATPGKSNATATFASARLSAPVVSVGSKLFSGSLSLSVDIPEGATLMYTTDGSLPKLVKSSPAEPWTQMVINGDCEGTDATSLVSHDADGSGDEGRILDGVGYNGSRGIKVHTTASAGNDWDAQFFVYTPDHIWRAGDKYRFTMWVRADKEAKISTQTHETPHDYIYWKILDGDYTITTNWMKISYEGTITNDQVNNNGVKDMQTIAFNLSCERKDNNFYFDDISWELYTADGVSTGSSQESKDGQFTISATTNYTFRLFKDGYLPSVPVTRSYIKTSSTYTLPVVSIVGDKRFFTDPKIGLDCDGDGTNGIAGNGQDYPKNYNRNWDRPVNFSYLSSDGQMLFNQDVNIEVSGGWTRSQRFRSFKLKSNKIFDGQNRFDFSFFPQKPYIRNKALVVRNGGNDVWTHGARFMDPALETIIQRSGMDVDVQSYVPVIEYVNGELRGVLNLREPNNDKFAYANWGYDDDELDAFENLTFKNGTDEVLKRVFELGRQAATNDAAYEELKTLLDIDEFTNYMAVTMFLDNRDWPNNNIKGYRSQKDGRYRFVSFDLDYAFGLNNAYTEYENTFKYFENFSRVDNQNKEIVKLLLNLLGHDEYRRKFIDTFCLIGGSVFEPTRAGAIIDELLAEVEPMCQLMKDKGISDGHNPGNSANTIKNRLDGRSAKMAGYMKDFSYLNLSSTEAQAVTLKTDTEGAHLFVNGIDVPYADFNGHLFAPVKLRAEAPAGYSFAGWKLGKVLMSTESEIALPSGSSVELTATFTKLSDEELAAQKIAPVRINEVSADDGIYVNDYFKRKDWVELYNTTDAAIDVEGMYLTDNIEEKPKKYMISKNSTLASTIIPAHGYLVIWCDKESPLSQLHASFKIDAEGDELQLMAADESWTDRFAYPAHKSDQTVGRYPDGSNNIYVMNVPTIAKANLASSYLIFLSGDYDMADARIVLNETETTTPATASAADVRVVRSLAADVWNTICLPFDMTAEQVQSAFGADVKIGDFVGWTAEKDGTGDVAGINVRFTEVTAMDANHPYIIKVTSDMTQFEVDDVNINAATTPKVQVDKGAGTSYFYGTYVDNTVIPEKGLFLNGNKFWYSAGKTKTKAFRGYFELADVLASYSTVAPARMNIVFDETTDIAESMRMSDADDDSVYNLQGQRVTTLKKGLYIKNGRVITIK